VGGFRERFGAYREPTDIGEGANNGEREIYCLICDEHGTVIVATPITSNRRIKVTQKVIARHLQTTRQKRSWKEAEKHRMRPVRRKRVGLTIARTSLLTLQEGSSYLQLEEKLHMLYLVELEKPSPIGSLNHAKDFIRKLVEKHKWGDGQSNRKTFT